MSRTIFHLIASLPLLFCLGYSDDTLRRGQSLNTSDDYIENARGTFGLGFFSTENSTKHYVAIFCSEYSIYPNGINDPKTIVWVANREHPFRNSAAALTLNADGNLVISDGTSLYVVANTSGGNDTYAWLSDSGNLIILTNTTSDILWQSFDYPTHTLLPEMKLKDAKTGWSLTSWKNDYDPAPGLFSMQYLGSRKELILMEGSEPYWTSSLSASGAQIDEDGLSSDTINVTRIVLDVSGNLLLQTWMDDTNYSAYNISTCGAYPVCGDFSICNATADEDHRCTCLPGFKNGTTFAGCERKTALQCSDPINVQKDLFLPIPKVYLPMYPQRLHVGKASECKSACFNNCSCTGYAYDQEHRCLVWDGPLLNLKHFSSDNLYQTEFYLKIAPPDFTQDTIRPGQSLNTSEIVVSANGMFGFGFFSPENSTEYYVGIRYQYISGQKVVSVLNREMSFPNPSAVLTFNPDGNLVISDADGRLVHVLTNTSSSGGNDTYARLLDTGNLILTNRASDVLWQSFDYPTDTILPGMKLKDAKTGWSITSWKNDYDPAPGLFSLHLGSWKELIIMKGSEPYWTSPLIDSLADLFVIDGDNITSTNKSRRVVLQATGELQLQTWSDDDKYLNLSRIKCGASKLCGEFSICTETAYEPCACLQGFEGYATEGRCKRKTELQCSDVVHNHGFLRMSKVFWPSNPQQLHYVRNASECESDCLNNCSCTGYAYDQERRCLVWEGPLLNLKIFSEDSSYKPDFHLKLANQDLVPRGTNSTNGTVPYQYTGNNQLRKIVIPTASIAMVVTLGLCVYYVRRRLRTNGPSGEDLLLLDLDTTQKANNSEHGDSREREVQMPLFNFASVSAATENFSTANKLGEGGFGPVYKGILLKGNEVAVKRLSKRSGQGWEELKNEATLIAKLQHKNLVRLLGCCIEQEEKILIYEYMPNKSLDFFLFDQEKRKILDWRTRVRVIEGIAQGLLYLHQYSRLRIIHRDLKPSNILLDIDMNPKISDFGMARIFGGNELQANTNRIVGTYGYMSLEYALEGLFSIKSDVFSFGVLLLEIVSGKKNTGFYQTDSLHLIGYAWELWTSDRGSDLVDPLLDDISPIHMVLRYVNIAFLCVQESAEDRPTMSDVVVMLSNETTVLPYPKEPAFLNVRSMSKANPVNSRPQICSLNGATISIMEGR